MKNVVSWWARFLRHHRPARVGFVLVALVVITAVIGPLVVTHDPNEVVTTFFAKPSSEHWFGADSQGYDLLSRMVFGARTTLKIGLASMTLSLGCGTLIGAVAGFAGGKIDLLLMRGVDLAMSFPGFLLAMVIVAMLGFEQRNLIISVGLVGAPAFARQVRAEVIRVSTLDYVGAARALGFSEARVLFAHVLPNSMGPIIVLGTLSMGGAILDVAGLNFLGLGGDPFETPEWGLVLAQGWPDRPKADLQIALAGLAIFGTVLGFNLLGDGLKDELDPRTRRRGAP